VLAHEIGHVLLRVNSHADTGLMKAHWTHRDYSSMALKNLEFTPGDADFIRLNLASAYSSVIADSRMLAGGYRQR